MKESKPNILNKSLKVLTFVSFFTFIISFVTQLYLSNHLATKGYKFVELEGRKEELLAANQKLKIEIAKFTSLAYVEKAAFENGFVEIQNQIEPIGQVKYAANTSF